MASLAAPAAGGTSTAILLPGQATFEESTFLLNGVGLREATWLRIKVYVAGLYLEAKSTDAGAILQADLKKRIVLLFVRPVDRKSMIKEWDESLSANIGADLDALKERIATLRGWMPDAIRKGDSLTLTYLPGRGVVVEIKGVTRGTIPGADFARALFGIWLGAKPPNESLKLGLLTGG